MSHTIAVNYNRQQLTDTPKIAKKGILHRVKFDQWHVFNSLRHDIKNVNVLNLAALLAALARMDCVAYEIPQSDIANKFAGYFGGKMPTRQAISKWENELEKCGLIEIPKAPGRGKTSTKRRVFTQKFINIACRAKKQNLSHTGIHATDRCTSSTTIRVQPDTNLNKIRANKINNKPDTKISARFTNKDKNTVPPRPPKCKSKNKKPLSKFAKSVQWWLWQNRNIEGPGEATILFALFLQIEQSDDHVEQLRAAWKQCGDNSRHGLINGLIDYLRQYRETLRRADNDGAGVVVNADQVVNTGAKEETTTQAEIISLEKRKFGAALCGFEENYTGPGQHIVKSFHTASENEQQRILDLFQSGAFDQYF